MKIAVCSAQSHDRYFLTAANAAGEHELVFFETRLSVEQNEVARDLLR